MQEDIDVPPSKTVIIVNGGDGAKYHRQNVLPWRAFACPITTDSQTAKVPRLAAEVRGYEPCLRPNCFGNPP